MAEIIRNARINASPLSQVGYAEADALIENGAILPPCKVGDIVYLVGEITQQIVCSRVTAIIYDDGGIWLALNGFLCISINQSLGKTVFLTKEEAEKALRGEGE